MLSPEEADEVMDGVLESGSYEEYVLGREVECEEPVDRATFDAFRNLSKYMATRWPGELTQEDEGWLNALKRYGMN